MYLRFAASDQRQNPFDFNCTLPRDEFVPTSSVLLAGWISRHVDCETGSPETGLTEWVTINNVNTLKDYGRHRLEYRLGTDGPARSLGMNVRRRFRLARIWNSFYYRICKNNGARENCLRQLETLLYCVHT